MSSRIVDRLLNKATGINQVGPEIAEIIKYEGDNDTFIWKHPWEDFYTGSQLIVHESQEAVFFMNGHALDLFGPGRHTLETQNLPLIGKFFRAPTGGATPFHCEVYFINKTEQMAIKWGTDSKLEYVEPAYGFPIQIGASGEMSLRVEDSRKLLVKVVGTELGRGMDNQGQDANRGLGFSRQSFTQKMRAFLLTRIKAHLATYIKRERINIFEIDEHLITISEDLHDQFYPDFLDYGIAMDRFFVTTIVKPEEDHNYRRFKELHFRQYADVAEARLRQQTGIIDQETQKQRMILEAEGMAQKRALEGYTYQDERGYDVAARVASNEAIGQVSNLGTGMAMMAAGGAIGSSMGNIMQNTMGAMQGNIGAATNNTANTAAIAPCVKCGTALTAGTKFCNECGQAVLADSEIVCPYCAIKTARGKFCSNCGEALVKRCPDCATEIPAGGKFCLECGYKI